MKGGKRAGGKKAGGAAASFVAVAATTPAAAVPAAPAAPSPSPRPATGGKPPPALQSAPPPAEAQAADPFAFEGSEAEVAFAHFEPAPPSKRHVTWGGETSYQLPPAPPAAPGAGAGSLPSRRDDPLAAGADVHGAAEQLAGASHHVPVPRA